MARVTKRSKHDIYIYIYIYTHIYDKIDSSFMLLITVSDEKCRNWV